MRVYNAVQVNATTQPEQLNAAVQIANKLTMVKTLYSRSMNFGHS